MGALSAGSDRASTIVQVAPLPLPVDEDAALVQDAL
jgi:hypothetical protein